MQRVLRFAACCLAAASFWPAAADVVDDLYAAIGGLDQGRAENVQPLLEKLDAAELVRLCARAAAPEGDDTLPRMAVHAYAVFAGEPGHSQRAEGFTAAVSAALKRSEITPEGHMFLLRQLAFGGGPRAISAAADDLTDPAYSEAAIATVLSIGGDSAAAALRAALARSTPETRVGLIRALGVLRDTESVTPLLQIVRTADGQERTAAMDALAEIGDPRAMEMLLSSQGEEGRFAAAERAARYLTFARRMAQRPDPPRETVRSLLEGLVSGDVDHVPSAVACAALHVYAEVFGATAMPQVLKSMESADDALRATSLRIAEGLGGADVSRALADALSTASDSALRAAVVDVLRARKDASVRDAVLSAITDFDEIVRRAAIEAATSLGGAEGLRDVLARMEESTESERLALTQALQRLEDPSTDAKLAAALKSAPDALKPALLDALARRGAEAQLPAITAALESRDESVRVAALRAMGALGGAEALDTLVQALVSARGSAEAAAAEDAVVSVCNRRGSESTQLNVILQHTNIHDEDAYVRMLSLMGRLGGDAALRAIANTKDDPRSAVREAAARALARWPDGGADAGRVALDLATRETDERIHVLALRALAHILESAKGRDAAALELAQKGIDVARRPDEKKLIISKLGAAGDAKALDALRPYLNDPALRTEAASATLRVAESLLPGGWPQAREAVASLASLELPESLRTRAKSLAERIGEMEGFITDWLVAGPFTQPNMNGMELFNVPFKPEPGVGGELKWMKQPVTEDPARYWFIDINANPSIAGDNRAAYLQTYVYSEVDQPARLELGSDDGIKAWVNEDEVLANNVPRGCEPGQDRVDIKLRSGRNRILLKITNLGGGFAACARLRAADGGPLSKIRIDAGTE